MRFKSHLSNDVTVSLTDGRAVSVSVEGNDVPMAFFAAAVEAGCIPLEGKPDKPANEAGKSKAEILADAIKDMMDNPQEGYITGSGLPNLKVLSKKAGWTVSSEEMMAAVQSIVDEPKGNDA